MDNESKKPPTRAHSGAPREAPKAYDKMGLEEIVQTTNRVGMDYVKARRETERLELMKPTIRARISLRLDDGSLSEAKLKRLTETDQEYVAFLEQLVDARERSESLRIRYESYKNLFDARRSLLIYQKAEMKLI